MSPSKNDKKKRITAKKPTSPLRVTPKNTSQLSSKIIGAQLERWRMEQHLTHAEGAEAFGLPIAKWYATVRGEQAKAPLDDHVLALIKCLYTVYPESAPKQGRPDVREFYDNLGLTRERKDMEHFAWLIGRQPASVYRLLSDAGKPSRPLIRYIEALNQLGLSPGDTLRVMQQIAKEALIKPESGD
jgi:hypothetical protein